MVKEARLNIFFLLRKGEMRFLDWILVGRSIGSPKISISIVP